MHGIGGRTIAEAQETLSYREFQTWCRYRRKRGSMNVGMRVDRGAALLAALYSNAHSKEGGKRIHDFAPHEDVPTLTLEQAMKEWA